MLMNGEPFYKMNGFKLVWNSYSSCNIILHAFRLLWAMSINHRGALIRVRWVRMRRAMSQWGFSRDAWRFCGCTARICPTTSSASRWCRGTKLVVIRASTVASDSGEFDDLESSLAYPNAMLFWCFLRDEPMLCISDALMCDGIRQCPEGGGMFNDEDEALCKKHRFDDQDLKNVRKLKDLSLLISFFYLSVYLFLESPQVINLATFDARHLPKHLRSNRVNFGDLIDESNAEPSRLGNPSDARHASLQRSQKCRHEWAHQPQQPAEDESSRAGWDEIY